MKASARSHSKRACVEEAESATGATEDDISKLDGGVEEGKRRPGNILNVGDKELEDVVIYIKKFHRKSLNFGEKINVLFLQE